MADPAVEEAPATPPRLAQSRQPLFLNGDFEQGTLDGWNQSQHLNNSITYPPAGIDDLRLQPGGLPRTYARFSAGGPESAIPAGLSAADSLRWPRFGHWAAVVNELTNNGNVNILSQSAVVTEADVDPVDGRVHVRFAIAPVLEDPGHAAAEQPYFYITLRNVTRELVLWSTFNYSNQPGVPWKRTGNTSVLYTDWQLVDIAPGEARLAEGDTVELQVIAAGCSPRGHWGHVYVDGFGSWLPGLSISASAPQSANADTDLTYTYLVRNDGVEAASHATATLVLPANTTFVSVEAPGATCTRLPPGGTGTVTCNLGTLAAGSSTTFRLTVHIDARATGKISHGDYSIRADGVSPLLGRLVETRITRNVTYADLSVVITNSVTSLGWEEPVRYTLTVSNAGPSNVSGATLTDTLPAQLTNAAWTCVGEGGASCGATSGRGDIQLPLTLPAGGRVTLSLDAAVVSGTGVGRVRHLVAVAPPEGIEDPDTLNNEAVDDDTIRSLLPLTVHKQPVMPESGTVVSSPAGIDCGPQCSSASARFFEGSQVTLTAQDSADSVFVGWDGACAGPVNPCTLTITEAHVVVATFKKLRGATCGADSECLDSLCVDGVCCDSACSGQCEACDIAGHLGTCMPVTGTPRGGRPGCASDDTLCGGSCDGTHRTACTYPDESVQCLEQSCIGNEVVMASTCDGAGRCRQPERSSCTLYTCGGNACRSSCELDDHCSTGAFCLSGQCRPQGEHSRWTAQGSGGCSGTGGASSWWWPVLILLALLPRRKVGILLAILAVIALPRVASAQSEGVSRSFVVDRFQPQQGASDVLGIQSARVEGHLSFHTGLFASYADQPLQLISRDETSFRRLLVGDQLALTLVGSMALFDRLELGVGIPVMLHQYSQATGMVDSRLQGRIPNAGLSDIRLSAKLNLLDTGPLGLALALPVSVPTATPEAYLGGGGMTFSPRLISELRGPGGSSLVLNMGVLLHRPQRFLNLHLGPALTGGLGGRLQLVPSWKLSAEASLEGMWGLQSPSPETSPLEMLLALRWQCMDGLDLTLGGGPGLTHGYGTPRYRLIAGLSFTAPGAKPAPSRLPSPAPPAPVLPEPILVESPPPAPPPPQEPAERIKTLATVPVLFATNKAHVLPASLPLLDELAVRLSQDTTIRRLRIEAHTDNTGNPLYNQFLSEQRARWVRDYLIQKGIEPNRLEMAGFGMSRPIDGNNSPEGRAKNRRVEFILLDQND